MKERVAPALSIVEEDSSSGDRYYADRVCRRPSEWLKNHIMIQSDEGHVNVTILNGPLTFREAMQ